MKLVDNTSKYDFMCDWELEPRKLPFLAIGNVVVMISIGWLNATVVLFAQFFGDMGW